MSSFAEKPENEKSGTASSIEEIESSDSEATATSDEASSKVENLIMVKEIRELQKQNLEKDRKMKELQSKLNDYDIKYIEARAFVKKLETEVEQIRLRAERDLQKNVESRIGALVQNFLPIIDTFDLSLKSAERQSSADSLVTGLKMLRIQIEECLKNIGLERIKTVGEIFDPHIHEALMNQAVDKSEQNGIVVLELKAGYRLGALVVRPAQVAVGQYSE